LRPVARPRGRDAGPVLVQLAALAGSGLEELWLCAHRENLASQRAALRAGYRRDPGRDKSQEVKDAVWPMLGYVLRRPGSYTESG
jgi:[ribosomal protein S5]-alanine N-acetyltransferase